jgi:hypothetical protein
MRYDVGCLVKKVQQRLRVSEQKLLNVRDRGKGDIVRKGKGLVNIIGSVGRCGEALGAATCQVRRVPY